MPEPTAIKVLLVDDHPVVRQGLAGLLTDEGFDVVGDAATTAEAEKILMREAIDLLVVDLTLDRESGFDVLTMIRRRMPKAIAVVYSVHEDGERVRRAIQAGAMGFVSKREDPEVLVKCLRRAYAGERFLSPRAARAMADILAHGDAPIPEEVLSKQELEVYAMAGRGFSPQDTASEMGLSVRTVETYYGRILEKLKLSSRRELRQQATEWLRHAIDR